MYGSTLGIVAGTCGIGGVVYNIGLWVKPVLLYSMCWLPRRDKLCLSLGGISILCGVWSNDAVDGPLLTCDVVPSGSEKSDGTEERAWFENGCVKLFGSKMLRAAWSSCIVFIGNPIISPIIFVDML